MMEKMNLSLVNLECFNMPVVEGAFRCKNGTYLSGYFLIDTGSVENVLNSHVQRLLPSDSITKQKHRIVAVDNEGEDCLVAKIDIALDKEHSCESFCISSSIDFESMFDQYRIIGLLGSKYLRKNGLVLDLEKKCLRSSMEEDTKDQFSFLFPMGFGFETYGVPIVGVIKDDQEYLCVADSGCNINTFALGAMKNGISVIKNNDETCLVASVSGVYEATNLKAHFDLLSIGDTAGETKLVGVEDDINVIPDREFLSSLEDENIPPISGLLSTKFMASQKWILDFKHGIIYSYAA